MTAPVSSDSVERRHAPLVQRVSAIIGSSAAGSGPALRCAGAPAAPGPGPRVSLERTSHNLLRRAGPRHAFSLSYRDPTSDAVLAALLAALAAPGMPIAADPETLSVLALAERLAVSEIPVLIGGPTGTGKEVLSRFIHARSPRAAGPFVAVNCAAMPETMLEALLFGHRKGAFTGASEANEGFFRAADGGTLLLDEIAEMPLALQAKLLRALQEGEVVPIGSTQPITIDVRIIACANRDLPTEVAEGRFRADLFYRLNVFPLSLRPLRERAEDIAPLAFAMVLRHTPATRPIPWLSDAALTLLRLHGWPGNVRELENVLRRALVLAEGLSAYVLNGDDGAHLMLKGATGASNAFVLEASETPGEEGLAALAWTPAEPARQLAAATSAQLKVDGLAMVSASNTIADLVPGLSLTLTGTNSGAPTTVRFSDPASAVSGFMTDLTGALNELVAELNLDVNPLTGELARDSGARALRQALSSLAGSTIMPGVTAGQPVTLADLGLATNRDGTFRLDTARLAATSKASPAGVSAMLTNGIYGVFASLDKLGRSVASASDPGTLAGSLRRLTEQKTKLASEKTALAAAQEKLRAQMITRFAATDTRVGASRATLSFLRNQIDAWNAPRN